MAKAGSGRTFSELTKKKLAGPQLQHRGGTGATNSHQPHQRQAASTGTSSYPQHPSYTQLRGEIGSLQELALAIFFSNISVDLFISRRWRPPHQQEQTPPTRLSGYAPAADVLKAVQTEKKEATANEDANRTRKNRLLCALPISWLLEV